MKFLKGPGTYPKKVFGKCSASETRMIIEHRGIVFDLSYKFFFDCYSCLGQIQKYRLQKTTARAFEGSVFRL
jgi:hypothetical protein